jgi:hypothetical protein
MRWRKIEEKRRRRSERERREIGKIRFQERAAAIQEIEMKNSGVNYSKVTHNGY